MMKINKRMKLLLERYGINFPDNLITLNVVLRQIIDAELVEVGGCFFLESLLPSEISEDFVEKSLKEGEDRTGLECAMNNLYIQSVIYADPYNNLVNESEILNQGLSYAFHLSEKIGELGNFTIILSYSNETEELISCSVRFHSIRLKESWLNDDLDGYMDEALLILQ